MSHHVSNQLRVNLPAQQVWQVLEDYSSVEKFAVTIKSSPVITEIKTGVGAKRRCTFNNGDSLVEEIITYQEGHGFEMALSEFSMPLKSMKAGMYVKEVDTNTCEIIMTTDFETKAGPLGWLMGVLLMKPIMKSVFRKIMTGLAVHAATGEIIGEKLPETPSTNELILN